VCGRGGWGELQAGEAAAGQREGKGAPQRLPRFYHSPLPATKGVRAKLGPAESKHAARVLRLQQGDLVELCDGQVSEALPG
jgi:hypothetical protein